MDKDRIKGSIKQVTGNIKEMAGKILGDNKVEAEGKAEQVEGKVQNAVGGLKDTAREALKKN
ncbi:CsbD family protein [Azospirillum sp. Sh1]|uniref:CsbD family protein n=1 Tax=Azospirillum sp. Sh1 TaxID=2607285 RepID=UPI0011EFBDB4|nr:CsbD family protein [Azospirillum sp. Sh1]KAA0578704.1 CsbD family protein [Azospirillum sp. Sh1]